MSTTNSDLANTDEKSSAETVDDNSDTDSRPMPGNKTYPNAGRDFESDSDETGSDGSDPEQSESEQSESGSTSGDSDDDTADKGQKDSDGNYGFEGDDVALMKLDRDDESQNFVDQSVMDFDPDVGVYNGTVVHGTSKIEGPHVSASGEVDEDERKKFLDEGSKAAKERGLLDEEGNPTSELGGASGSSSSDDSDEAEDSDEGSADDDDSKDDD